jgi:serine/threonine-protein kinase
MVEPASRGASPADPSDTSSARRKTPFGLSMTVAGRYRRGACIAKGGSSTVHRAIDTTTGAEVALKSFHVHRAFDPTLLPTLERGRAIAERVGPDVMVPILDLGADDDGTPFVIMPLVPGETLGARLERGERVTDLEALAIASRLLVSLDALHACGVTHGDLSPDNVLVRDGHAVLMDHEGIDAIGGPRASRVTEGFGREGGVRETADDHRALVSILRAITGRAITPEPTDTDLARIVAALRTGDLPERARALDWTLAPRARATPILGFIVGLGLVLLAAVAVWFVLQPP